ncbi:MAG: nicotinate-nucleotide--dimethylbenzimidazole phosphoribosyltransferase [Methyloceanibacter sp.]
MFAGRFFEALFALAKGRSGSVLGAWLALDHLKLEPILDLGMRLGEGTGALLALPIVRAALAMHAEMRTFEETKVSRRL